MKIPKWLITLVVISLVISAVNLLISLQIVSVLFGEESVVEETNAPPPEPDYRKLITERYNVDEQFAYHVVRVIDQYTDETFPTKKDMVVLIGIESSFRPHIKSKLKRDKAEGLTQIRPGVWKHIIKDRKELRSVDGQIKYAVMILKKYHQLIGTKQGALLAYNNGLTNYRKGKYSMRYWDKFQKESSHYMM